MRGGRRGYTREELRWASVAAVEIAGCRCRRMVTVHGTEVVVDHEPWCDLAAGECVMMLPRRRKCSRPPVAPWGTTET